MNLTPAEQWAAQYQLPDRVTFIRQIQADAIRWAAAEIQKQDSGFIHHNVGALLVLANQLHPKP